MDKASSDKLAKVHPELAARVVATLADLAPMDVRVVQGLRTYAQQDALYAQGRTKGGQVVTNGRGGFSNHNFGLAVDLCPFKDGQTDWDNIAEFNLIGSVGVKHGLHWGGSWKKFIDKPHLELPTGLTLKQCRDLIAKGGLTAVWQRASQLITSTAPANTPTNAGTSAISADDKTLPHTATVPPIILQRGAKGYAVRVVQKRLIELGYVIQPDGDYGDKTYDAVVRFQRDKNIYVDGRVGPESRKELGL